MRHWRGKLDMAHALAPDLGERDLDAAFLADDALVLHALVLAAQALVVLHRAEDARAEQAVALRLEGAVVDRLGLLDLPKRPGQNLVRAGDADPDLIEILLLDLGAEEVDDFLIHSLVSYRGETPPFGWWSSLVEQPAFRAHSLRRFRARQSRPRRLVLGTRLHQLDIQAKRPHFLDKNVERLGDAGLERVVAAHDGFVHFGAARHVVGFDGEHLLQRIGRAIRFERPHLHFAETLAAELRLAAERLLGDEAVRADRARVDLLVHEVVELEHIDVAPGHLAFELFAGAAVVERDLAR